MDMRHMTKLLTLAAAPVAIVAAAPAPAASLEKVAAHLRATQTMTADFTQTAANGTVANGRVIIARPGKIRFQFEPKVPLLVVADGRSLAMIDYEVAQVSKWPIRNTPLAVLLDPSMDLKRFARVVDGGLPGYVVIEAKDPKHPEYGTITLYFRRDARAPAGLALEAWRVLDAQGNITQVQLSNVRFNVAVDKNSFTYRDPRPLNRRPGGRG